MKTLLTLEVTVGAVVAFICSYFFKLTMENAEQYLAVVALIFMDGFFGIIAGTKREGFKTFKALKVLQTLFTWIFILTVLLMIEKGITGTEWISETVLIPFIIFQVTSVLKNAARSGYIQNDTLLQILKNIDKHKS